MDESEANTPPAGRCKPQFCGDCNSEWKHKRSGVPICVPSRLS